jgi:hypothetical protein
VVHPGETVGGEGAQDERRRTKEAFHLHDLLLPEDRLEPVDEREAPATERLVDQVDLEPDVA